MVKKHKRIRKAGNGKPKRTRRTPLEMAMDRNTKRHKQTKGVRPGVRGSHPARPRKYGLADMEILRLVLTDAWMHSKAYGVLKRCLNFEYLTKKEERYYEATTKKSVIGFNTRWKRFKFAMEYIRQTWPKPPITGKIQHEHEHTIVGRTRQATLQPKSPQVVRLLETQRKQRERLLKKLHEPDARGLVEGEVQDAEFSEINDVEEKGQDKRIGNKI